MNDLQTTSITRSAHSNEYRFPFRTEKGAIGALVLQQGVWSKDPDPVLTILAYPPMWEGEGVPDETTSRDLLKLAEDLSGLKLAYTMSPWQAHKNKRFRLVTLRGRNDARMLNLLPPKARA